MDDMSSNGCINESLEDKGFLEMELEALQSIYINEIEVKKDVKTTVSIDLYPATADKLDKQYVRMTLQFILDEGYPDVIPEIRIRNPRGLSDENLDNITEDLLIIAEEIRGNSMLFEMIEAAKEHLTVGNRPSGQCAICLYGFNESDVFTKTECYHYFHSHCLARYSFDFYENIKDMSVDDKSKAINDELLCPVCRIPIDFKGAVDEFPPPLANDDSAFSLSKEIAEMQEKMADLYQKQLEKGGIIDIEAEKNKFLLEISNVPTQPVTEKTPKSVNKSISDADIKPELSDSSSTTETDKGRKVTQDQSQRHDDKNKKQVTSSRTSENRTNDRVNKYDRKSHYQSKFSGDNCMQSSSKLDKYDDTVEEKRSNYQARNGDFSLRHNNHRRGYYQNRGYSNYNRNYRTNFPDRDRQQSYPKYNTEKDEHSSGNSRTDEYRKYDNSDKRHYRGGSSRGYYDSYSKGNYSVNRRFQDNSSYKRNSGTRTYYDDFRYKKTDTQEKMYNRERNYKDRRMQSSRIESSKPPNEGKISGDIEPEKYVNESKSVCDTSCSDTLYCSGFLQNSDNLPVGDNFSSKETPDSFQDNVTREKNCLPRETVVGTLPGASNAFSSRAVLNPPPGFANPMKKVIYGLQGAKPPPGFQRS